MDTPRNVFQNVLNETGDPIAAIKSIRKQFGLTLVEAKEIWLQVAGIAGSALEHQRALVKTVEEVLKESDQ